MHLEKGNFYRMGLLNNRDTEWKIIIDIYIPINIGSKKIPTIIHIIKKRIEISESYKTVQCQYTAYCHYAKPNVATNNKPETCVKIVSL